MCLSIRSSILIAALVGVTAVSQAGNQFVNRSVKSGSDLAATVKSDNGALSRYMAHFSMSRTEVLSYLGSLQSEKLAETGLYTVYSVDGGKSVAHVQKLVKGEPVLADALGTPVILASNGNPLTAGASASDANHSTLAAAAASVGAGAVAPMSDVATVSAVTTTPITFQGDAAGATVGTAAGLSTPAIIGVVVAAGGIIALSSSSNGGNAVTVVPEPVSLVVMGVGLVGVATRRRRAKQSR